MSYTKTVWEDLPSTNTPITTENLNNIENGIETNDKKLSGEEVIGNIVVDSIRTKNMFDSSYINNRWVGSSGSIDSVTGANARRISCASGDTFTLSATFGSSNSNNIIAIAFYNASGTLLDRQVATNSATLTLTRTAPSNTSYMYVGHYTNLPTTIQLEEGSTATTYTPYQNLDGVSKDVIETQATLNGSYFSTIDTNKVFKQGNVVQFIFRGLISTAIPNNTNIITLPFTAKGGSATEFVIYTGGEYDVSTPKWCYLNSGQNLRTGGISSTGVWVHINITYISF